MMDLSVVMPWIIAAMTIINFGGLIQNMISKGEKENTEKLKKAETKLVEYDRRIQALEGDFKHLPSKDDIHTLVLAVEIIKGELGKMGATYDGVNRTVRRIEDYLMEERPKA